MIASTRRWGHVVGSGVGEADTVVDVVTPSPSGSSRRPTARPTVEVRRTSVRSPPAWPRSAAARPGSPSWSVGCPGSSAGGVATGCGSQRCPLRDRWRTRRGPAADLVDEDRSTTVDRSECGHHLDGGVRSRAGPGSGRSSRQSGAALGATRLEDRAPSTGTHPRTKTVLAGPATVVRLVGTFHSVLRTFETTDTSPGKLVTPLETEGRGHGLTLEQATAWWVSLPTTVCKPHACKLYTGGRGSKTPA